MIHLAWFGPAGVGNWRNDASGIYDWRGADIYKDIAKLCERAKFDMVLFSDTIAIPNVYQSSTDMYVKHGMMICHDPVPVLTMMGSVTERLGLATTISTTFYPPYLLARMFATLDHLTNGRMGWNIVTSVHEAAARNFGLEEMPEHDDRYDMADEYLALCRALWRSWAPDSLVLDRQSGIFADPSKVKPINFSGKYYKSQGPLSVVPSPQGEPVAIMAGASPRGMRFAIENAEVAIAHKNTVKDMKTYTEQVRAKLSDAGRDPRSCKIFFAIRPIIGETESIAKEKFEMAQQEYAQDHVEVGLAQLSSTLGYDMSKFELDQPLPKDMKIKALQGKLIQYTSGDNPPTLREIAKHEAAHETFPIYGTPEQIADIIEHAAKEGGADGFHFRHRIQDYNYLLDVATKLVPVLQKRGLVRKEYTGTTLRHHLNEF